MKYCKKCIKYFYNIEIYKYKKNALLIILIIILIKREENESAGIKIIIKKIRNFKSIILN